jgi:polysaccharide export outer membrane protein
MTCVRSQAVTVLLACILVAPLAAQERARLASPGAAPDLSSATAAVTSVAPKPLPQDYVIGPDDVLHVYYWKDQDLSAEAVVRPDGRISLPLLRDIPAMGLTPGELGDRIQALAATYLEHPNVTVVVKQINSRKVFITGEISKPGLYPLAGPTTVLQLIAIAGGVTPFARQDRIVVMRNGENGIVTFRFNYKDVLRLKDLQQNILLLPGDTVLVP